MLADEPEDQFLRYALAMELEKEGEHEAHSHRTEQREGPERFPGLEGEEVEPGIEVAPQLRGER